MTCRYSKEALALYVGDDLAGAARDATVDHLEDCEECRCYLDELRDRHRLLKSLRHESADPADCLQMRRAVMTTIRERGDRGGWALQFERALVLGVRQHAYALAAFAFVGVVSVSALAQMRQGQADASQSGPQFEGADTLLRPEGFRNWMMVDRSSAAEIGAAYAAHPGAAFGATVYVNPAAYRAYLASGSFPDGTLLLWESSDTPHGGGTRDDERSAGSPRRDRIAPVLLASVKDSSRFANGWAFFDFTGSAGQILPKARPLPESSGCGTCHRRDAPLDHVFTTFVRT